MKKSVLGLLPILFIQLISAQFFSGYGRFSISDLFSSIDPPTMTLGLLFLIFFAFIFFVLGRVFKDSYGQPNKGIAGTISFAVSALIIYGLWNSGFDFTDILYSLGFSADALYFILPIIILLAALLIIWKFGIKGFLIVLGLFIIILTVFTEVIYEKGIAFAIGLVMFIIGLWLSRRGRSGLSSVGGGTLGAAKGLGRGAGGATKGVGRGARWAGEKVWKNRERIKKTIGRARWSKVPAEEETYKEKAKREAFDRRVYMKRAEEEAIQINSRINQINAQIKKINSNISGYGRMMKKSKSSPQDASIQQAINDLKNQRMQLEEEKIRLTRG